MKKQVMVIGLGQFGLSLARSLAAREVDVLAVDTDPQAVQEAAGFCAEALAFDATEEGSLARTAPARRDVCVCAMGGESRESAIIVTALLRQMGAPRVVARATDELMERILRLVGAHEVVNPERAFGERLANRMLHEGLVDQVPLGEDLVITELHPPRAIVGRTLVELSLPKRFGVTVVGTRRMIDGKGHLQMPDPRDPIREDDIIVIVAPTAAVQQLMEKL